MVLSGDAIPVTTPRRIANTLGDAVQLICAGGPTEDTIWSISYPVPRPLSSFALNPSWKLMPYGRPFRNMQVHVLDENLQPCPTWVACEIFFSGVGVARGYIGGSDTDSARFLVHPLSGERMHRSGDLGRIHPDGYVEILGRKDNQVKVNGYRIELEEVEAAARATGLVQTAMALLMEPTQQTSPPFLVLCATLQAEQRKRAQNEVVKSISAAMQLRVPSWMVPAQILIREEIPLSENGKLDRRTLRKVISEERAKQQEPHPRQPTTMATYKEIVSDVNFPLNPPLNLVFFFF